MHNPWVSPVKCFESQAFKVPSRDVHLAHGVLGLDCVISQNIQKEKQISKREACSHMAGVCCPRSNLCNWKIHPLLLGMFVLLELS
jgi:hypothetical protein